MKTLKSRNGILFLLLMAGLIFNILWSGRLESQPQELTAKVFEHHKNLMRNSDDLEQLDSFMRTVGAMMIAMDNDAIVIGNKGNPELGFAITTKSGMYKENAVILFAGGDAGSKVKLSNDEIYIKHGFLDFGMDKDTGLSFQVRPQKGDPLNFSMDPDSNDITIDIGGKDFYVKLNSQKQQIEIKKDKSVVRIGKGSFGEGVELGEFDTGTIAIARGKGVAIEGAQSLGIYFDGDINIGAKGNVNIRSDNGDVKINGKKVRINE